MSLGYLKIKIRNLQEELIDSLEFINYGGCVHFAYYFSNALKELKIDHKVVFLANRSNIDESIKNYDTFSHIMIHIPKIGYVDGHDTFKTKRDLNSYESMRKKSSKKTDLNLFRMRPGWNTEYDTSNNEYLEATINKYIL